MDVDIINIFKLDICHNFVYKSQKTIFQEYESTPVIYNKTIYIKLQFYQLNQCGNEAIVASVNKNWNKNSSTSNKVEMLESHVGIITWSPTKLLKVTKVTQLALFWCIILMYNATSWSPVPLLV